MTELKKQEEKVYAQFLGDDDFPVDWKEGEADEFWWYDDLHIPRPVSPMYFDIGGWWGPSCEYMFRRFGVPFGKNWTAKKINGYTYTMVTRRNPEEVERLGSYFNKITPVYATNFLKWWEERYLPEIEHNLAYLDNFPYDKTDLAGMMIHFEDALDIQERHFRIHWILNLAQFTAFTQFSELCNELIGEEVAELVGKVLVSVADKNWDSTKELWRMKEEIKTSPDLVSVFEKNETMEQIVARLEETEAGRNILKRIDDYKEEYGYKAIYSHEYIYPLWKEDPAPIFELLRGYVSTDYDYYADHKRVYQDQQEAINQIRAQIENDDDLKRFENALELALGMAPLTPDHHFYIDQGTYARMRIVLKELGRKFVERGDIDDPEDIFYLVYDEVRQLFSDPDKLQAKAIIAERKVEREEALGITPRDWVGTADHWSLYEQAYVGLWGYPERFELSQSKSDEPENSVHGLAASPGVIVGRACYVDTPEDFDKVKKGDILVCSMTNPAWTLVFTKISGLVTDSGGVLSHPAVVAREFGIPAVTSTLDATTKIKSGQRIRVDGNKGVVEVLRD